MSRLEQRTGAVIKAALCDLNSLSSQSAAGEERIGSSRPALLPSAFVIVPIMWSPPEK